LIPFIFSECSYLLHEDPSNAEWDRRLLAAVVRAGGADGGSLIWFDGKAAETEPSFPSPVASRLQLPLRTQDGVYGAIHLYRLQEGDPLPEARMELLETFISMVALIIENKRTQGLLKRENESLRLMDERAADLVSELGKKSVDLEAALQTMVNRERLAILGQLAAAVAHQIRNPLSVIGAHVELMMGELGEGHGHYGTLSTISRKVSQTESIIRELMELARPLALQLSRCNLHDRLESIARFIAPKCRLQKVEVRVESEESLPQVWLDATQFERCLLDLAINALQQMPSGGVLDLACRRINGSEIELCVQDSGPGIRAEHMKRIFEPFFSLRPGGTGLGLYNVRRICQEMGIEISVENGPNGGASFNLVLPLCEEKPAPIFSSLLFQQEQDILH
jgi:signal transduction histidine kinase